MKSDILINLVNIISKILQLLYYNLLFESKQAVPVKFLLFLIFLTGCGKLAVEGNQRIDLTAREMYVRNGFSEDWIRKMPESEDKNWLKIASVDTGNRSVRVVDLDLPNKPTRHFFEWKSYPVQQYTYIIDFYLTDSAMSDQNNFGLFLGSISENWAVYLNGRLVKKEIFLNEKGEIFKSRYQRDVVIDFNKSILKSGQNILAFQIMGDPTFEYAGLLYGNYEVSTLADLLHKKSEKISLILMFLYLMVGFYHLLLYFNIRQEIHNLYFAGFCILLSAYLLTRSNSVFEFVQDTSYLVRIEYILLGYAMPVFSGFWDTIISQKISRFTKFYFLFVIIYSFLIMISPLPFVQTMLRLFQISVFFCMSYGLFQMSKPIVFFIKTREKTDQSIVIWIVTGFFSALKNTISGNLLIGTLIMMFTATFDILDSVVLGTGVALTKYGFFIFVISIALILANKFLNVFKMAEQLNTELEYKNLSLAKMDRLKDDFLANTSHELRTPLNGIIGLAESLIDGIAGSLNNTANQNLSMIVASGKRLSNLVNDILDFSKLRNKDLSLNLRPLGLNEIAQIVLTLSQPLVRGKDVKLINEIPKDTPPVLADENRLQQILYNLVGNAVKFTEKGEVKLKADIIEKDNIPDNIKKKDYDFIRITVSDTGIGIPEDKFNDIFKTFEQVDASVSRKYGGTGLGLSITKQLIELHQGTVTVDSEIGKGSNFNFYLPVSNEKAVNTVAYKEESEKLKGVDLDKESVQLPESSVQNSNLQILVVDDEPVNQQVLANHLSLKGYNIIQAFDGSAALKMIQEKGIPDLILLDIMMPGMSGYEVCQKLREIYPSSGLPVIMITAKNQVNDLVEGFDSGANDYITKPFSKNELLSRIKTHLHLSKVNKSFSRFVPYEFLKFLQKESITDIALGDAIEKEMTIFFSDIRSFTTLSEGMSPDENFGFINSYMAVMGPCVRKHKGFIDKYIGDAIMALFPNKSSDAIDAAIEMLEELHKLNLKRQEKGYPAISIGIGIHTGSQMLGIIGEKERMEGTVISDVVNTASRLEGLTKTYSSSLLVSSDTLEKADNKEKYFYRQLDTVKVKGKNQAVNILEILNGNSQRIIDLKLKTKELFEKGISLYLNKDFENALKNFEIVFAEDPRDKAAALYIERCNFYIKTGTSIDWDGAEKLNFK